MQKRSDRILCHRDANEWLEQKKAYDEEHTEAGVKKIRPYDETFT